ncbi:MAG: NusG domain II-containing protein [Oscillospiraceae bacterium]|jgi:hypothetical protein|nr:NusG domain II-containing protein [Oscillospiraceae bacterium]
MKRWDALIIAAVLLLAGALYLALRPADGETAALTADIYLSGVLYDSVPLSSGPLELRVPAGDGFNLVHIAPEGVSVRQADCPGGQCVAQGVIRRAGESVACLPHRLLVVLSGASGERGEVDAVVG